MRNNLMYKLALRGLLVWLIIFPGANDLFAASAVLSWTPPTTNDDGTELNDLDGYKVYYGTESGNYSASIDAGNVVTYEVNNLSAGTTYYFATTAYNTAGGESQYSAEANKTFPVPSDKTPSVISGVQTSGITDSSATVSWTTNEASDTRIQYGMTTSYGMTTVLDPSMVTSHSKIIGGLEASQLYHYSVISRDAAGNETVSGDYTFATLASPEFVHYYCDSDNDGYADTSYDGYCIGAGCEPAGCQATPGSDCNDSNPAINPDVTEVCDNLDNNCDGSVDENLIQATTCGVGECGATGEETCTAGVWGGDTCSPGIPAEDLEATCGDGLDNDCDILIDSLDPDCYPQDYYCDSDGDGHFKQSNDGVCIGSECQAVTCQFVAGNDCDDNNPAIWDCYTQVSDDPVTITDTGGDVTVTFSRILSGGNTIITTEICQPGQVQGITMTDTIICADITTDAVFEGMVEVCSTYDDAGLILQEEESLSMIRCDEEGYCDLLTESGSNDTVNNIVCGLTEQFDIFAVGIPLDSDNDGYFDLEDNCSWTSNPGQQDTDSDGYGNMCDCDLDNDDFVGPQDFNMFVDAWWTRPGDANWNADADFDGDDFVGPQDFNMFVDGWWTRAPWD